MYFLPLFIELVQYCVHLWLLVQERYPKLRAANNHGLATLLIIGVKAWARNGFTHARPTLSHAQLVAHTNLPTIRDASEGVIVLVFSIVQPLLHQQRFSMPSEPCQLQSLFPAMSTFLRLWLISFTKRKAYDAGNDFQTN